MKSQKPLVSIVSVNWNNAEITLDMVRSFEGLRYTHYELIIVDNGSTRGGDIEKVLDYPQVKLIKTGKNLGFAGGTNVGIRASEGEYILLLNNDTVVNPNFLDSMVQVLEDNPKAGVVSPKIYFYDDPMRFQYAGGTGINPLTGRGFFIGYKEMDEGQYDHIKQTYLCSGACMMVRREVFEEIGLLSERYFMYYEEHDFTERAQKAGWMCYYTANSFIHHKVSLSMGKYNPLKTYYMYRNRLLFMRRVKNGPTLIPFKLYYYLLAIPKNLMQHTFKKELDHAQSILKGLTWHFQNHGDIMPNPSYAQDEQGQNAPDYPFINRLSAEVC